MHRERLLKLLELLIRYTDMDHKLSINELCDLLSDEDIQASNRKTLYDDFKLLSKMGYEIEYDNGYYLLEAPFSLSEIKIMVDSLNSLRNLDEHFLADLKKKLYSFISIYETKKLKKLEYKNKHRDRRFLNRLEDVLSAINDDTTLIIQRVGKDEEEISPLFLHRQNDLYYLYYHYPGSDKIYHCRFDNILSSRLTDHKNDQIIPIERVLAHIDESTSSFHSGKGKTIRIEIIEDSPYIRQRLEDDFPNLIFTKKGFSIKASVNDAFFSKLVSYKDQIKISDRNIADQYIEFLEKIITRNS
ncbi:MAG: WYL domain-containing protein [Erysipelotrichaceae bacterium]|nr:WYL domain-containing protein [Erysipelotrichaceae bacterium]